MKTKLRNANRRIHLKVNKLVNKNAKKRNKKQNILHGPETKSFTKNNNKINRIIKQAKIKNDELLVVGQGSEQVQLSNNFQMKILDLNHKFDKRLKIFTPCKNQSSSIKLDKLEANRNLEARFKILSPYVKNNLNNAENDKYVSYDIDDKDKLWIDLINKSHSGKWGGQVLSEELFEWLIDQFEKASKFQHQSNQTIIKTSKYKLEILNGTANNNSCGTVRDGPDDDAFCCICGDGEGSFCNNILFCELCNIAVHQECYGVPHIPDGSWVCRACYLCPSRQVECCLCPVRGGALKQTYEVKTGHCEGSMKGWVVGEGGWSTGEGGLRRWAHIMCAAWVPEVSFANNVFLEPVDDIDKIAPARWKLKCVVCLKDSVGACIQCHKAGCYAAFHITCAALVGFRMKIDFSSSSSSSSSSLGHSSSSSSSIDLYLKSLSSSTVDSNSFKKVAYCHLHSHAKKTLFSHALVRTKERMKVVRAMVRRGEAQLSITAYPCILHNKLEEISKDENFAKLFRKIGVHETRKTKNKKINKNKPKIKTKDIVEDTKRVLDGGINDGIFDSVWKYWMMKRLFNNGVPLVSTAQSYTLHPVPYSRTESSNPIKAIKRRAYTKKVKMTKNGNNGSEDDDGDDKTDNNDDEDEDAVTFKEMKKLRQQFEKVRLLHELIRKRERLKLREIKLRNKLTMDSMSEASLKNENTQNTRATKSASLLTKNKKPIYKIKINSHEKNTDAVKNNNVEGDGDDDGEDYGDNNGEDDGGKARQHLNEEDTSIYADGGPSSGGTHQSSPLKNVRKKSQKNSTKLTSNTPKTHSTTTTTKTYPTTSTTIHPTTTTTTLSNSTPTFRTTTPIPPRTRFPQIVLNNIDNGNLKLLADIAISHKCHQDSPNEASAISTSQSDIHANQASPYLDKSKTYEPCDSTTDWLTGDVEVKASTNNNEHSLHMTRKRKIECDRLKNASDKLVMMEGGSGVVGGRLEVGSFVWAPWSSNLKYPARLIQVRNSPRTKAKQTRMCEVDDEVDDGRNDDCLVMFYDSRKTSRWIGRNMLQGFRGAPERAEFMNICNAKHKRAVEKAYHRALHDLLLSQT